MQYPSGGSASNLDTAAYSLQYWTGSAWAAVQGGSASGNLSVVRRISFAPVTTTKLKITLKDDASNNYSNNDGLVTLAEVEAWTAPALTAATQRFDAYGMPLAQTAAIPAYGYTGREPDATGLVYYRARYYDPSLGRFISRDPLGLAGGLNSYGYVGGNPVNFNDPSGLMARTPQSTQFASLDASYFGSSQGQTFGGGPTAFDFGSNVLGGSVYSAPSQPSQTVGNQFELPNSQGIQVAQNVECPLGNMSGACGAGGGNGGGGGSFGGMGGGGARGATVGNGAPPVLSGQARLEVMRQQGIPTSQQPVSQSRNSSGYEYQYEVPKPGGGIEIKSVQQQTLDRSHPDQGHWEAGSVKIDPLTGKVRMNEYGRPKLTNDKSKVDYNE